MQKPFLVETLERHDPELLEQMEAVQALAACEGALPHKVKTLMAMLGDAILGHPEGVKAPAAQARAQGATEEEVRETVRMAFFCAGMPGLVTATRALEG